MHFRHSGNAGDVVYALPCVEALAGGRPAHFHLYIDQPADYNPLIVHPMGNVMMNRKTAEMLQPLLAAQPYISSCTIYEGGPVDVDLDSFRGGHIPLDRGHIARWYFQMFGVSRDLGKPWLFAQPDEQMRSSIVVARSNRYQMPFIAYDFLRAYDDVVFVGLPDEFEAMKKAVPGLRYRPVADFLELAGVIAGAKMFIGNQSFPFSIAEGLKVRRLLELDLATPNVIVEGADGYDFCFQDNFERLVHDVYHYGARKVRD
ncbi:MAG: hypothetical protein EOP50_13770 [Sphingobacteriales bacterium]|nr:MAG: hypothetical protein EOP50_13770 [Sphingobacteriales bacterium]